MDLRNPVTFSRVYAAHAAEVEAIARRIVGCSAQAQDVAHDVFLRLWINPEAYDAARGDVGGYLRLLARSRAIDADRSRRAAGRAGERLRATLRTAEALMKSKAPAVWDEAELLEVSMTSRNGTADAEALGVSPRPMAAVLGAR